MKYGIKKISGNDHSAAALLDYFQSRLQPLDVPVDLYDKQHIILLLLSGEAYTSLPV